MAISGRLTRKLYETLGTEAGEDLVTLLQGAEAQRWEFRELHEATTARFEARLGEAEARLRQEIVVGLTRLETTIETRYASLLRWSFMFWIGSVAAMTGAVAALDRFLR